MSIPAISQGSRSASQYFLSRRHLDRPLPSAPRVLPRVADYILAAVPVWVCRDPWPVLASRARVDVSNLNREGGQG